MGKYYCIGKQVLDVKNDKKMELVCLQKDTDFGKMAEKMPVVAINNSKQDLVYGKPYDCKVFFKKDQFNNLYKADAFVDKQSK